ncbi:FkbM family methyltransferase [Solwaraspora sp. WMMD406]|uniref:FkbM family methyltransferase n=1 Tax=Solwaraspora sp. WMMD406 TaxID=3016095 RepID=UPI002415A585|nr:FkbM family methyltransferase [Solwaraspora sp. WMMD406]MDG4764774.1 FkbM family methyltransferase [Solwaraspora sp. WMMD406]
MAVSLRRRILDAVDDRVDPRIIAGLGGIVLSLRARSRCVVRYEDDTWIHRYRGGTVVNTELGGLSAEREDEVVRDTFLYGYQPRPGDTVVDIGAGVGTEVRLFSRMVGDLGRVLSIEAHPRTFRCLRRTVELNRLSNVTLLECAVVDEAATVRIDEDALGHIRNGISQDGTGGIEVAGRRLDEILRGCGVDRVDLLKMNIEGAELSVLEGSRDVLDVVDNLVVSCHDFKAEGPADAWMRTFVPVQALLHDAGYTITTRPADPRPWIPYYVYASRGRR